MKTFDRCALWFLLFAVLYFGWHFYSYLTRPLPQEIGREIVLNEIKREWNDNYVFHVCSDDGWCLKLIPRRDDKSLNLNIVMAEGE